MSNYGLLTKDNDGATVINAKNPIFGFDMGHNPRPFKTFHITDTYEPDFYNANLPQPTLYPDGYWSWGESSRSGTERVLVKRIKHGYTFRPVGYATITGDWKLERKYRIQQTQYAGNFGGNYTKVGIKTESGTNELTPNPFNKAYCPLAEYSYYFGTIYIDLDTTDFSGSVWPAAVPQAIMTEIGYGNMETTIHSPIDVEIDDEYINIYYNYVWSDTIRRARYPTTGTATEDVQERVQVVSQYTSSVYNITVYLCPFPIKELL